MAEKPKDAITLRIDQEDKDVLDALVYLLGKTSRSTKSPNDVLGPVVAEYLQDHANDPGVQLSVQAAHEARRASKSPHPRAAGPRRHADQEPEHSVRPGGPPELSSRDV